MSLDTDEYALRTALRSAVDGAVPSLQVPDLGGVVEQAARDRRRRRTTLAAGIAAVAAAAAVLVPVLGSSAGDHAVRPAAKADSTASARLRVSDFNGRSADTVVDATYTERAGSAAAVTFTGTREGKALPRVRLELAPREPSRIELYADDRLAVGVVPSTAVDTMLLDSRNGNAYSITDPVPLRGTGYSAVAYVLEKTEPALRELNAIWWTSDGTPATSEEVGNVATFTTAYGHSQVWCLPDQQLVGMRLPTAPNRWPLTNADAWTSTDGAATVREVSGPDANVDVAAVIPDRVTSVSASYVDTTNTPKVQLKTLSNGWTAVLVHGTVAARGHRLVEALTWTGPDGGQHRLTVPPHGR